MAPPARHVLRSFSSVLRSRQFCSGTETKKVVSSSLAALGACLAAGGPGHDDLLSDNTPLQVEGAYSVEVGTKKDPIPKPPWMKRIVPGEEKYFSIKAKLRDLKLHTVCEEAKRLNIDECWTGGQMATATIMTLNDTSTQGSSNINPGLDINWDNLGFGYHETDYMFVSKSGVDGKWEKGEVQPLGDLKINPSAGVLNYGQGIFEGLKAYRTEDGRILLFRPEENAMRMIVGADRLCMPAPPIEVFVKAVKQIVLANMRWIPPPGKGSLYIRPLLIGSGAVLGLAPSPEYSFVIFVAPVGNYFKEGISPIHLKVEDTYHRAAPGGTGGVKTIGNYASVLKTQLNAKKQGFSDVLYLDAVENKYLEEVSSCNIFLVKGNRISTPQLKGTILPGITRKSIIELARSYGYEVEECDVSVDALRDADEVFCSGTAVVISPVGSISFQGQRILYANKGLGKVSQELYAALTSIQMGKVNDKMAWTMEV